MYTEQLPPHDTTAEEAVLGGLLIDGEATARVSTRLKPEDFYHAANQQVFEAILAIFERGDDVHTISVADELARQSRLEDCGGHVYLSRLVAETPTSIYVDSYRNIVHGKSVQRQLVAVGSKISEIAFKGEQGADELLARADALVTSVHEARPMRVAAPLLEGVERFLQDSPRDGRKAGMSTGFVDLDAIVGGFFGNQMIIVAATTGSGKSAFAANVAMNVAQQVDREGRPRRVLFISQEMSERENVARLLSRMSGLPLNRVLAGPWNDMETDTIVRVAGELAEIPIHISDTRNGTVASVRAEAKLLRQEYGLDLIVVDYLQLLDVQDHRQNRTQQVTEITRSLKKLAMELAIPVLAISQLSRAVNARPGHEPVLSDLRESGTIEQDADVVLFVHRAEQFATEEQWRIEHPGEQYLRGQADLIVAKQRNGPVGRVRLRFNERTTTFENVDSQRALV